MKNNILLTASAVAILCASTLAFADYGEDQAARLSKAYEKAIGHSMVYIVNGDFVMPEEEISAELNWAYQQGYVIGMRKQQLVDEEQLYDMGLENVQNMSFSSKMENRIAVLVTKMWVQAVKDGFNAGQTQDSGQPQAAQQTSPAKAKDKGYVTYSCTADITKNGKRTRYQDQKGPWSQVIADYGTYFSWDLPHGNRGNSTGQDVWNGMDDASPDLSRKLAHKATEADGSQLDELKITDFKYSDEPDHTVVYARRIKPSGTREYYVTDVTGKVSWMFLNCKQG